MARNSRLALAALASMNNRALAAAIASGSLTKSNVTTVLALRANGSANDEIAKYIGQKVLRDRTMRKLGRAIGQYAQKRVQEVMPMVTATTLLEERVAKSRDTERMISEAIHKYQAEHPGVSRQNAIDAVLFGPQVREILKLERQLDEVVKAKNTLPQHRATTDIDFNAPIRGQTGYNSGVDDRRPLDPDAGEEPTVHDHNEMLTQIRSGQIPFSDPRVSALVRFERKAKFGS